MMEGLDARAGCGGLITLPFLRGESANQRSLSQGDDIWLNLGHTKQHLYRSALEGIGFSVPQHIDIFRKMVLIRRGSGSRGGQRTACGCR